MDLTVDFFAKLKKLAVTLESETSKLQRSFENRHDTDSETTARAMRAYHELNCDVGNLKLQIQEQLTQQRARKNEVSSFITACRVMEQKISVDILAVKEHWEKYGYRAPEDTQRPTSQSDADENESKSKSAGGEDRSQDEPEDNPSSSPPLAGPPPVTDALRTPQLSDFGLSEMQLKRALAGADWCSEVPPMPEISLPHPSLNTPAPPPMPITPKCALRMDDDDLQTPQMHNFGISDHTMCLLNDFTMDLLQKNIEKPKRLPENIPAPAPNSLTENPQPKDNLESPDPPVFCTPGFKIKKSKSNCSPPAMQSNGDPESPNHSVEAPTTPEVPAFQTPYFKQLVSAKKNAQQTEPINTQADDDVHAHDLPTLPVGSKRKWEYNVPKISVLAVEDEQTPEMPNLECLLGNSLQSRSSKILKDISEQEVATKANSQEQEGPVQEFSLGTPRLRKDFQEPSTPEMPDLSSVTQDICKLLSQAQMKRSATAVVHPNVRTEKDPNSRRPPPAKSVSAVSESEFKSLPGYLKQMTLHNLNLAIHDINKFLAECRGEQTEFQMEDLRRITSVGVKTPVYVLCLTQLNRLAQVGGAKNSSVYKLCTNN
ncbi:spindle and kinetochore-associated protein 3 [Antennarius striatus]|uniref:spindle and kinetochore-associated protein 3 n=1 Tax=Antennarius striatus TaxID=241820 RepID=UPI0035ADCCFE